MLKTIIRLLIIAVLLIGIVITPKGYIDQWIHSYIMSSVKDSNDRYLEKSFEQAMAGFLVLSGVKSGLAIIEGSEIGVGFNLELGDVVQSVYDYVNIAWKTVLAGATVLLFTQLILETVELIDQVFLCLMFLTLLVMLIMRWYFPRYQKAFYLLREVALLFFILSLSLYLILPFAIKGSAYISKRISYPLIHEAQDDFAGIENEFSIEEIKRRLFPEDESEKDGWFSKFDVSGNLKGVKERFEIFKVYLTKQSEQVAKWTIKLIAGYVFDCIVFPLSFFVILFVFTKSILRLLFRFSQNNMIRKDIEEIFQRHHGRMG